MFESLHCCQISLTPWVKKDPDHRDHLSPYTYELWSFPSHQLVLLKRDVYWSTFHGKIHWSSCFWIYCQKLWTGMFESFHVRVKDRFFLTFNSLCSIGRPRLMRYFQKAFLPILLHAPSVVKISFLGSHSVICTKKILKWCA